MDEQNQKMMCNCPHHKVVPGLITLLGLVFLLSALNVLTDQVTALAWPIILMVIGINKMFVRSCKCCVSH